MKKMTGEVLVALALILAIIFIIFVLINRPARGGEMMDCSAEPQGRDWSYRTNVGGRPDRCWYSGPRMKSRSELRWPNAPDTSEAAQPGSESVRASEAVPVRAQSEFEDRWSGLYDDHRIATDPTPIERWK